MHSFSAYCRMNVTIGASNLSVVRAASRKINPKARFDPARRCDRHACFPAILDHHDDARDLAARHRL